MFDLAQVEATGPEGQVTTFQGDGRPVPCLYPGYTDDGGHLNASGQQAAGNAAVDFMAAALVQGSHRP